ncbi:hypothetical protein BC628DRAFT_1391745 [Trametes gibbosa]|nr:hypothetical protein BC628DRAFT_1391745 [Trametes gibbosa]
MFPWFHSMAVEKSHWSSVPPLPMPHRPNFFGPPGILSDQVCTYQVFQAQQLIYLQVVPIARHSRIDLPYVPASLTTSPFAGMLRITKKPKKESTVSAQCHIPISSLFCSSHTRPQVSQLCLPPPSSIPSCCCCPSWARVSSVSCRGSCRGACDRDP